MEQLYKEYSGICKRVCFEIFVVILHRFYIDLLLDFTQQL